LCEKHLRRKLRRSAAQRIHQAGHVIGQRVTAPSHMLVGAHENQPAIVELCRVGGAYEIDERQRYAGYAGRGLGTWAAVRAQLRGSFLGWF
jgi:hypothetical protein